MVDISRYTVLQYLNLHHLSSFYPQKGQQPTTFATVQYMYHYKSCVSIIYYKLVISIINREENYRKRETTAENKQTNPIAGPGGYNTVIVTITIKIFCITGSDIYILNNMIV